MVLENAPSPGGTDRTMPESRIGSSCLWGSETHAVRPPLALYSKNPRAAKRGGCRSGNRESRLGSASSLIRSGQTGVRPPVAYHHEPRILARLIFHCDQESLARDAVFEQIDLCVQRLALGHRLGRADIDAAVLHREASFVDNSEGLSVKPDHRLARGEPDAIFTGTPTARSIARLPDSDDCLGECCAATRK